MSSLCTHEWHPSIMYHNRDMIGSIVGTPVWQGCHARLSTLRNAWSWGSHEKTLIARLLFICAKTRSWNGIWGIQRLLWPWQTWKYHGLLSAIKLDNLKKLHHQGNSETIRAGRKAKDPASCRILSPIMWHEIRWSPWKVWKSVFQTNNTKELKTPGAECHLDPQLLAF